MSTESSEYNSSAGRALPRSSSPAADHLSASTYFLQVAWPHVFPPQGFWLFVVELSREISLEPAREPRCPQSTICPLRSCCASTSCQEGSCRIPHTSSLHKPGPGIFILLLTSFSPHRILKPPCRY